MKDLDLKRRVYLLLLEEKLRTEHPGNIDSHHLWLLAERLSEPGLVMKTKEEVSHAD